MRFLLSVSTAFVLFFFISCQKEFSVENGTGSPTGGSGTTTGDSIYLDKVTELIDTDDSSVTVFKYDNLKRVSTITQKSYINNVLEDTTLISYLYNGTDTLPYKYVTREHDLTIDYFDTVNCFVFYDAQKRFASDSGIYTTGNNTPAAFQKFKIITTKRYTANNIYSEQTTTGLIMPPGTSVGGDYKDTAWLDANKNIISNISYYYFDPVSSILNAKGTYTYDNKPNPYHTLNIFNVLYNIPGVKGFTTPQINNYLSYYNEDWGYSSPPNTYSTTFQNVYNSKGQLTLSKGHDNIQAYDIRDYYVYKAL